jgi:signal transduction histidine kinase
MSGSPDDFQSFKPGGHVCLPFAEEAEKHGAIAGFFHDGLLRGERCMYWGSPAGFSALLPHLEARGVPVESLRERSVLIFADPTTMGRDGFDPSQQTAELRRAAATAHADGYAGLRVAGDPEPRTRAMLGHEQLAAFEASLSQLFADARVTGLCTFDQRATDASSLEVALASHEVAIVGGRACDNPFFHAAGPIPNHLSGYERVAWMAASILENTRTRELLEAENAALIVQNTQAARREVTYRKHIATLTRSLEARDRLLVTAARWLSRPLPAMCGHLEDFARDESLRTVRHALDLCSEHVAAIARLSRGLDEIAGFLQLQVVLRPERIDMVEVARAAIAELRDSAVLGELEIGLEGVASVSGNWDRLRLLRLFHSLIGTAHEQGYETRVTLRIEDLIQFARVRLEFMLPHPPALSDSGERARSPGHGPAGESDYERLAVHTWSAREIVRLMGGTLGVSTWADARVVFTLDLPKAAPEGLPAEA